MNNIQPLLFKNSDTHVPITQSIKYSGSKLKLLPYILELVKFTKSKKVLDGFSGSTRVSQALSQLGYQVISNDTAIWSEVFGNCYLKSKCSNYDTLIKSLNKVRPKHGWFTEFYGGKRNDGNATQKDGLKKPWQIHNTKKLDGIREEIDKLSLSPIERSVALTSLILALDRVDNTLGHYVSYLKKWSPRSYDSLILQHPRIIPTKKIHKVIRGDVFNICNRKSDLAYFDPPYGSNNEKMPPSRIRYASYYHLWTTICLNDRPQLFGKSMRRGDSSDKLSSSVFEEFRRNEKTGRFIAVEALHRLIKDTKARWVILSYSSGGRGTLQEIKELLSEVGDVVNIVQIDYKRNVMSEMKWTYEWTRKKETKNYEFLFLIDKS